VKTTAFNPSSDSGVMMAKDATGGRDIHAFGHKPEFYRISEIASLKLTQKNEDVIYPSFRSTT